MIFFFWAGHDFGGETPTLPTSLNEWSSVFPDIKVFGDEDVIEAMLLHGFSGADVYKNVVFPACRSDIARLVLLYAHGGLYIDSHVGLGDIAEVCRVFARLARYEVVLFDKTWERISDSHRQLINGIICARQHSPVIRQLAESAIANLREHSAAEQKSPVYIPYNIAAMTGAWNILIECFDIRQEGIPLRASYERLIDIVELTQEFDAGLVLYKHYGYRRRDDHWSERQGREFLFRRCASLC